MKLNLCADTREQKIIKEYLENNASNMLADKINDGTIIQKDGKTLINKKTLNDFMDFANKQAQKTAAKGARSICIDDRTVLGWAVHYFEEEEIIGRLYNEDGSEYTPAAPTPKTKTITSPSEKVASPETAKKAQISMFDLINSDTEKPASADDTTEATAKTDDTEEVTAINNVSKKINRSSEDIQPAISKQQESPEGSPLYRKYMEIQNLYPDCIVAYRLGDFYEVFGKNAIMLAEELNLTLTGRDCGLESRVPMIGFPYHAADAYFAKIITRHKIAIAESEALVRKVTVRTETEDDIEEIPYDEMKAFDGDIGDPPVLDTISDEIGEDDFIKSIDGKAAAIIYDILGDLLDIQ